MYKKGALGGKFGIIGAVIIRAKNTAQYKYRLTRHVFCDLQVFDTRVDSHLELLQAIVNNNGYNNINILSSFQ